MEVTTGVLQGSVLEPTLWNFLYDVFMEGDTVLIRYADDLAVLSAADDERSLVQ